MQKCFGDNITSNSKFRNFLINIKIFFFLNIIPFSFLNFQTNMSQTASKTNYVVQVKREEDTLKRCFSNCVNNLHVNGFVNEEQQCIRSCAERNYSYYNHLENSMTLMENPLYLKFY